MIEIFAEKEAVPFVLCTVVAEVAVIMSLYVGTVPVMIGIPIVVLGSLVILGALTLRREVNVIPATCGTARVGAEGIALTDLRPIGKARIDGTVVEVASRNGVIDRGTPLRVVLVESNVTYVQAEGLPQSESGSAGTSDAGVRA